MQPEKLLSGYSQQCCCPSVIQVILLWLFKAHLSFIIIKITRPHKLKHVLYNNTAAEVGAERHNPVECVCYGGGKNIPSANTHLLAWQPAKQSLFMWFVVTTVEDTGEEEVWQCFYSLQVNLCTAHIFTVRVSVQAAVCRTHRILYSVTLNSEPCRKKLQYSATDAWGRLAGLESDETIKICIFSFLVSCFCFLKFCKHIIFLTFSRHARKTERISRPAGGGGVAVFLIHLPPTWSVTEFKLQRDQRHSRAALRLLINQIF